MKEGALMLARCLLLVISIFPLLLTVVGQSVASSEGKEPNCADSCGEITKRKLLRSTHPANSAVEGKDAHRQSASKRRTAQTVWIPSGEFSMGSDQPQFQDAHPWHRVHVDGFHIDKTLVTNAEYAAFVCATGYVTVAERIPIAKDYPGASPEQLVAGSIVFAPPAPGMALNNPYQWWAFVKSANWRHPEGPQSDLRGRLNHPVVQVAYDDVVAYCSWSDGRPPTEAEFEYAARGRGAADTGTNHVGFRCVYHGTRPAPEGELTQVLRK